jgi:predicted dehydrogenase
VLLKFRSGSTAIWDASRYNESEADNPRFTFGELRIDGTGGHLTMDVESTIRVKRLGQPGIELDYQRERKNFAGDCVFFLQRHFVDCMLSGEEFESSGTDYLNNVRIVDAAYESARTGRTVRLSGLSIPT